MFSLEDRVRVRWPGQWVDGTAGKILELNDTSVSPPGHRVLVTVSDWDWTLRGRHITVPPEHLEKITPS